jgi:hypothetical protein
MRLPTPSQDTMGTATLGIVTASRAGVSSHSVTTIAAARVGSPTRMIRARFLIISTRHTGTPSDKLVKTRKFSFTTITTCSM